MSAIKRKKKKIDVGDLVEVVGDWHSPHKGQTGIVVSSAVGYALRSVQPLRVILSEPHCTMALFYEQELKLIKKNNKLF